MRPLLGIRSDGVIGKWEAVRYAKWKLSAIRGVPLTVEMKMMREGLHIRPVRRIFPSSYHSFSFLDVIGIASEASA